MNHKPEVEVENQCPQNQDGQHTHRACGAKASETWNLQFVRPSLFNNVTHDVSADGISEKVTESWLKNVAETAPVSKDWNTNESD